MKRVFVLAGLCIVASASAARADNTDTGTVTVAGAIVAPLTASATPLIMPNLVRPSTGEPNTRVDLTCHATADANNRVEYQAQGNPFAKGTAALPNPSMTSSNKLALASIQSTGQCAVVTIGGEPLYSYRTVIGIPSVTGSPMGISMATGPGCVDQAGNAVSNGDTAQLPAGGTGTLRCGARVTLTSAVTATSYAGTFSVTVTYD